MFFLPNREQAKKIQLKIKTLHENIGGEYYAQEKAWNYLKVKTNIDLKKILVNLSTKHKRFKC